MSTLSVQVSASTDDARNINGGTSKNTTATTQHIGKFNTTDDYWNGFRWLNVTIPQGATINSATVDLYSAQVTAGTTAKSIWYGVLETNAATFDTSTVYPEGKPRTTASVTKDFTVSAWNATLGYGVDPVTVTSLVQEIVNQGSWASGNALAIVCHNNGSSNTNYIGHSTYDRATDRGAVLFIDYTVGGASQSVTLPLISSVTSLYTPTLSLVLGLPLLVSSTTLYAFSVAIGPVTISLPFIASGETLYAPTISPQPVTISLPNIASVTSLIPPTVMPSNFISLPLISSVAQLYAPTISPQPVTISLPFIASGETLYVPLITAGALGVMLPFIASTSVLLPPVVRRAIDPNELLLLGVG